MSFHRAFTRPNYLNLLLQMFFVTASDDRLIWGLWNDNWQEMTKVRGNIPAVVPLCPTMDSRGVATGTPGPGAGG
jgi:hypothetical protein